MNRVLTVDKYRVLCEIKIPRPLNVLNEVLMSMDEAVGIRQCNLHGLVEDG